jgi:hypothetical protein
MASQVPPQADAARAFALRWLQTFERDTGGDAGLASKLNLMVQQEQDASGIPGPVLGYVMQAIGELKYDTWRHYLPEDVVERMRRHHATRGHEWTALFAEVQAGRRADPDARGPEAGLLARRWMDLFHDMVGTDPETVANFRRASATEPVLRMGPGIDDATIAWLRKALAAPR